MKFSLKSLLIFTAIVSVLIGFSVGARRNVLNVIDHRKDFHSLYQRAGEFEAAAIEELMKLEIVQSTFLDAVKQQPKTTVRDVVMGLSTNSGDVHSFSGYFWESAVGSFSVGYYFELKGINRKPQNLVSLEVMSELNCDPIGPHHVIIRGADTEPNRIVADLLARKLGEEHSITSEFVVADK